MRSAAAGNRLALQFVRRVLAHVAGVAEEVGAEDVEVPEGIVVVTVSNTLN